MEIIYRALDGKEFDNEADCCHHEHEINEGLIMLNRNAERVQDTTQAVIVYLRDEDATKAFHALAKRCDDDMVSSIDISDTGLFYWAEGYDEYHYVDDDILKGLVEIGKMTGLV
jgi:hypothetical protein